MADGAGQAAAARRGGALLPLAVLALAGALIFTGLGAGGLHNRDEARHALVAQNILATGDWVTLRYEARPYFNKPPLKFWLTALTFRAFGVDEWTVRLWSALFGWGAVALTGLLGARLYGRRTGWLAAAILATTTQFLYGHCARTGELDSALLCFWALAAWLAAGAPARPVRFVLAGAAAGACGMVKHLGFAAEVLLILYLWAVVSGAWRRIGGRALAGGLLAALAVVAPWHLAMTFRHGAAFWSGYFGRELIYRGLGYAEHLPGPAWLPVIVKNGFFPWCVLLPLVAWRALRRGGPAGPRPGLLPLAWVLVVTAMVAVGRVKLPWYAVPLYPPLAILTASFLAAWLAAGPAAGLDLAWGAAWLILALSPSAAGDFNVFAHPALDRLLGADLFGVVQRRGAVTPFALAQAGLALTGLAAALAAVRAGRGAGAASPRPLARARSVGALALGGLALAIAAAPLRFVATPAPQAEIVAAAAAALAPADTLLVAPGPVADDIAAFYLRRLANPVARVSPEAAAARLARAGSRTVALVERPADATTHWAPDDALLRRGDWLLLRGK